MKVESFISLSLIGLIGLLPGLSAKDHEGDEWAGFGAKLKQAVKEGKLSEEDAKAKWMAAVRKKKEAHHEKGGHDDHKLRMMEAIKRAVAEGKLSEREAKAKWMAIHGERRDDHHDRGRRHDDHDGHRNKYDDRHEDHHEDHDDHHDGEHHDDEHDEHGQDELEEMHLDIERMHLEIELRKLHFEMERIEFDQDRERIKWDMDRMRMDHDRQRMQREMEQRSNDTRSPHGMNNAGPPQGPRPPLDFRGSVGPRKGPGSHGGRLNPPNNRAHDASRKSRSSKNQQPRWRSK